MVLAAERGAMRARLGMLLSPLRIAVIYLALGAAALVFSDVILVRLVQDPDRLRELQAAKGAVEVGLTALLIFVLVSVHLRATERKTREVERARDRLAFLNSLLRHHVLNRMNVVQGNLDQLAGETQGAGERIETIRDQSAAVVELVENVRALSGPTADGFDPHPVDVVSVLDEVLVRARARHPQATVDGPDSGPVHVEADDSLALVFEQLLDNAVEHNDSTEPSVGVDLDVGPDRVTVTVVDDGPGIPADALSSPPDRERRGHEGLGLYLVRALMDRYGGDVRMAHDEGRGGAVSVEFVRALSRRGDRAG